MRRADAIIKSNRDEVRRELLEMIVVERTKSSSLIEEEFSGKIRGDHIYDGITL